MGTVVARKRDDGTTFTCGLMQSLGADRAHIGAAALPLVWATLSQAAGLPRLNLDNDTEWKVKRELRWPSASATPCA